MSFWKNYFYASDKILYLANKVLKQTDYKDQGSVTDMQFSVFIINLKRNKTSEQIYHSFEITAYTNGFLNDEIQTGFVLVCRLR